jgi:hypothetical protein
MSLDISPQPATGMLAKGSRTKSPPRMLQIPMVDVDDKHPFSPSVDTPGHHLGDTPKPVRLTMALGTEQIRNALSPMHNSDHKQ